jgi:hypothetical protein
MFQDFAAERGVRCPGCGAALAASGAIPVGQDTTRFTIDFTCPGCGRSVAQEFERDDLEEWMGLSSE